MSSSVLRRYSEHPHSVSLILAADFPGCFLTTEKMLGFSLSPLGVPSGSRTDTISLNIIPRLKRKSHCTVECHVESRAPRRPRDTTAPFSLVEDLANLNKLSWNKYHSEQIHAIFAIREKRVLPKIETTPDGNDRESQEIQKGPIT